MGKTWVLRTDTKGTGAHMVPLERTRDRPSAVEPVFVPREPAQPPEPKAPPPRPPRRFKIVDVMTQQTLAEDASTRAAIDLLKGVRSTVDVTVYTWQEDGERWRLLTLAEQRQLWQLAHR